MLESEVKVAQLCPTLRPHGLSIEFSRPEYWSIPFSRVASQPRDWTQVSHITGGFFTSWAIREAL